MSVSASLSGARLGRGCSWDCPRLRSRGGCTRGSGPVPRACREGSCRKWKGPARSSRQPIGIIGIFLLNLQAPFQPTKSESRDACSASSWTVLRRSLRALYGKSLLVFLSLRHATHRCILPGQNGGRLHETLGCLQCGGVGRLVRFACAFDANHRHRRLPALLGHEERQRQRQSGRRGSPIELLRQNQPVRRHHHPDNRAHWAERSRECFSMGEHQSDNGTCRQQQGLPDRWPMG